MKLNGLGNRAYNIMFHTHTVSGIVISVALYIIFFAGAFTLFKDEFYQWENPTARIPLTKAIDYEDVLASVRKAQPDFILDEELLFKLPSEEKPLLLVSGKVAHKKGREAYVSFLYNPATKELQQNYPNSATTIGETLYRLHFLDQLPYLGRWLAGFVSLFFLFATVTGVLVHWRNIVSKFYGFSLKGARKQLWTNAHTVFGLIGLPFQLMYAVTGAFYLLLVLLLLPAVMVFFGGDQQKIFALIRPSEGIILDEKSPHTTRNQSIWAVLSRIQTDYPDYHISYVEVGHLRQEDAILSARIENNHFFTGDGLVTVRLKDGKTMMEVIPGQKKYIESVVDGIARVHFARFGGLVLRGFYFLMTLFTCFVIISGVLLWKEARNKKTYTDRQKRFHHRVTIWYLAICFGLFPAVPILFMAELLVPAQVAHSVQVNTVFFLSWLALIVVGVLLKTENRLTHFNLLAGAVASLLVPVVNGIQTGDWLWGSRANGHPYVLATDLFWLLTGVGTLVLYVSLQKNRQQLRSGTVVSQTEKVTTA